MNSWPQGAANPSRRRSSPFFASKVSETLLESLLAAPTQQGIALTDRECSLVQVIAEGHSNKQIANVLNVSLKVVETQRAVVMRKLDASSSAGIVRYAIRNGLVEP